MGNNDNKRAKSGVEIMTYSKSQPLASGVVPFAHESV
jgi:hypothetical protein